MVTNLYMDMVLFYKWLSRVNWSLDLILSASYSENANSYREILLNQPEIRLYLPFSY